VNSWFCLSIPRSVESAIAGPKEAKNPAGAKSLRLPTSLRCAPFIREQCARVCQASPNFNVGHRLIIPLTDHVMNDQNNRRKYMPDYAVWEIHPVMKLDVH